MEWLNNFVGLVACEGEAGRVRVDLHRASECLLRARCHAVGLVKDHNLVPPLRECDLLLRKSLDSLTDHLDTCDAPMSATDIPKDRVSWIRWGISPLSSLAFSSNTASLYESPSSCLAKHSTLVVLPIPGMPEMMTCGMLPSRAMIFNRSTVSVLPTMSSRKTGRYFSTLEQNTISISFHS